MPRNLALGSRKHRGSRFKFRVETVNLPSTGTVDDRDDEQTVLAYLAALFHKWLFLGADWVSSFVYHSCRDQARGPQVSAGISRPLRVVLEVELGCTDMAFGFCQFVM